MKIIKYIIDLLNSIIKAWPTLVIAVGWIISAVLWGFHLGQAEIVFSIPLSFAVAIVALCLYPIAKFTQFIVLAIRKPLFEYQGLKWKRSLLPFGNPKPQCPTKGCRMEALAFIIPPPPIQIMGGPHGVNKIQTGNCYEYQCPIHGKITSAPSLPLSELQLKAKLVQRAI